MDFTSPLGIFRRRHRMGSADGDGAPPMRIQYAKPAPAVAGMIRTYYLLEAAAPSRQPVAAELANVRFNLAGRSSLRFNGRPPDHGGRINLIGPTNAAYVAEVDAGARIFGAGLLPLGWSRLIGAPAHQCADQMLDLAAVAGRTSGCVFDRMQNSATFEALVAAADSFFLCLLNRQPEQRARAYPLAMERWLFQDAAPSLDALMETMALSHRQIDRIAKEYFGASPKLLQRKQRALNAADFLMSADRGRRAAAADNYYDQSHFIKEFRHFLGATPGAYQRGRAALMQQAMRGRAELADASPLFG